MKSGLEVEKLCQIYAADEARHDFERKKLAKRLRQYNVKFGEYLLHFEMAPLVFERAEIKKCIRDCELVMQAAEIFTKEALKHPEWLRDCLGDPFLVKLCQADPGYPLAIPCARFDTFPTSSGPLFVELNTDGSSGMSNLEAFHKLYLDMLDSLPENPLKGYGTEEIMPHVMETLLYCYRSFAKAFPRKGAPWPKKPSIAIVDWETEDTDWEFYACMEYFRSKGFDCLVADPKELKLKNGRLSVAGREIHLIYRRLLGEDWAREKERLKVLTKAYMDHAVCVVGSPRSQIAFSKKLFAYFGKKELQDLMTPAMRKAIERGVPFSAPWESAAKETSFHGQIIDLHSFVKKNRERFVLKPCVSKCGFGIVMGSQVTDSKWRKALKEALDKDFIIQEALPLQSSHFPSPMTEERVEKRYLHAGVFVFGGKFSGFYGRTCKDRLLSLRNGERLMAILYKK